MKTFANSILITGVLAIFANTAIVAQTSNPGFEQWYRAKYGRPAPTQQTPLNTPQASPIPTEAAQPTVAVTEFEHWYRAKYGRPSPTEQALLKVPEIQFVTPEAMPPMAAMSESEQSAKTPAEHQRLAQSYRAEAQGYLAQAKEHEAMVAAYKANSNINAKNQAATIGHCEYFAAKLNGLAVQSQERAQMHEQMAKDAGK
jgi:hypothetical protein